MSPEEQFTPPDSPKSSAVPTPSSFGLGGLFQTPVQTIVELKEEDEIMTQGQITPDSIDVGIPQTPSDWLQPDSP